MNQIARVPSRLDRQMFTLLDQLFDRPAGAFACVTPNGNGNGFTKEMADAPLPLDLSESGDEYIIRASLPGFPKDTVSINVEETVLTIRAEHREQKEESNERFIHSERRFSSVSRRVELPGKIDTANAKAELKDGVLTVRLPKAATAIAKSIAIQ